MPKKTKPISRRIKTTIDCVFKAILGDTNHTNVLLDFLNSVLESHLIVPITQVQINNPYNEKEYLTDKYSIVDIKASDENKTTYQIEVQLTSSRLAQRMAYTLSQIYQSQLGKSQKYSKLRPAIAIWICDCDFLKQEKWKHYHHHFQLRDDKVKEVLTNDLSLHAAILNDFFFVMILIFNKGINKKVFVKNDKKKTSQIMNF